MGSLLGRVSGVWSGLKAAWAGSAGPQPAMEGARERSADESRDDAQLIVDTINRLKNSQLKQRIIVMTGAGISTAAGIPDFRSPGSGLYDNLQQYNIPHPQAIFEINYFRRNPKPFYALAKQLDIDAYKPTKCHYFIRLLADEGLLLRNYTQNVDLLERRAGVDESLLVEAHGTFHTAHCLSCGKEHSLEYVQKKVYEDKVPMCSKCLSEGCASESQYPGDEYHGLVKPDVVFFGEALPERFSKCAEQDFGNCELLMVMGTSLMVQPFASLVSRVSDKCPRVLINRELSWHFDNHSGRDVFLEMDCDEGCEHLAGLLGWKEELERLYKEGHEKLDKEMGSRGVCGGAAGGEEEEEMDVGVKQQEDTRYTATTPKKTKPEGCSAAEEMKGSQETGVQEDKNEGERDEASKQAARDEKGGEEEEPPVQEDENQKTAAAVGGNIPPDQSEKDAATESRTKETKKTEGTEGDAQKETGNDSSHHELEPEW